MTDDFTTIREALPDPDAECHEEDAFEGTPPHTYAEAHLGEGEIQRNREALAALERVEAENSRLREAIAELETAVNASVDPQMYDAVVADNTRLREALKRIGSDCCTHAHCQSTEHRIARAALNTGETE